ncbi:MAG: glycosyltransferase 87 family protein [Nocardioidaceae bacterium]
MTEPTSAERVLVTHEDSVGRSASGLAGGPAGKRFAQHPWWTPVRVVLAVATVVFMLGMVQKTPCVQAHWAGKDQPQYRAMCYSDAPFLYTGRGLAERVLPYTDTDDRYPDLEYPVLTGYFMYVQGLLTQLVVGWPDISDRAAMSADQVYAAPGVDRERQVFFKVGAVMLFGCALIAAWFLAGVHRRRPYDAIAYAAAPMLVFAGLVNWDYLAVCLLAGALWAWARGRPVLTGVFIGLGTAAKLYPVFLLGALLVLALRRDRGDRTGLRRFGTTALAAAVAWLLVNLPAMLTGFEHWKRFWSFNSERGPDLGSLWLVIAQTTGKTITPHTVNWVSELLLALACLGILVLGLKVPQPPRVAQLAFLIVAAFLLVNKVYSPQYVMWLLPLAVLARPRWRDLLIWQSAELFYFCAVWWYLGGFTSLTMGGGDQVYWIAIVVRVCAQLWFAGLVIRDMIYPELDLVRATESASDPGRRIVADRDA